MKWLIGLLLALLAAAGLALLLRGGSGYLFIVGAEHHDHVVDGPGANVVDDRFEQPARADTLQVLRVPEPLSAVDREHERHRTFHPSSSRHGSRTVLADVPSEFARQAGMAPSSR